VIKTEEETDAAHLKGLVNRNCPKHRCQPCRNASRALPQYKTRTLQLPRLHVISYVIGTFYDAINKQNFFNTGFIHFERLWIGMKDTGMLLWYKDISVLAA
jgi:hypothetical protein